MDEIDSLLSSRRDGENESSRRIKTEFLLQFEVGNRKFSFFKLKNIYTVGNNEVIHCLVVILLTNFKDRDVIYKLFVPH